MAVILKLSIPVTENWADFPKIFFVDMFFMWLGGGGTNFNKIFKRWNPLQPLFWHQLEFVIVILLLLFHVKTKKKRYGKMV